MTMSTVVPVKEDIGNPRFWQHETRDAERQIVRRQKTAKLKLPSWESADARLAREHLICTSLLSLDPSLSKGLRNPYSPSDAFHPHGMELLHLEEGASQFHALKS
jgi:hypothetical protein